MTQRTSASWPVYVLGALCAGAIVAAFLLVGPASGSQSTVTRTAKAAQGVVQSTVSGSGNLAAASQLNLGFKTSGTVTHIYITQGQHVTAGQLLATLNPESAEVTLEQSKAALQSAEANLAKEEETGGETGASQTSGGSSAAGTGGSGSSTASAASAAYTPPGTQPTTPGATTVPSTTTSATTVPAATAPVASTPGSTTPAATAPTSTTPAASAPTTTTPSTTPASKAPSRRTATTAPTTTSGKGATGGGEGEATKEAKTGSPTSATVSAATREANLASARAAVKSDRLTVRSDEEAVQDTKLYAPEDGTIVSLSGQVGEVLTGSGTTKASSGSSSSGSGSSTAAAATGGASALGATGSSSASKSSSSSSTSSSAFAVLSDLSSMQLVVPLSESEIGNVKAGQPATVTVEALSGAKLAAHVSEVALLSTSSSGAVSYDVTFQLDQMEAGLKVGMSATAEVVVKQAEGVNVPTSAISADSVTVERNGKQVRQRVTTGLAGNTSTIVLSGLQAGETVVLPAASTTSSSTSLASRLGGRTGAGGLGGGGTGAGGGGGFAGAGGGAAFFRGGG
jgi:multidrug efflux pump subunit AcrA (membrane-fusion protein)